MLSCCDGFVFRTSFRRPLAGAVERTCAVDPGVGWPAPSRQDDRGAPVAVALADPEQRGRVFELAVGAEVMQLPGELFYWWEKNAEVDFVYRHQGELYAIEVKSGRKKSLRGLEQFMKQFPHAKPVIVTPENFVSFSHQPKKFLAEPC
ncbi:DUF4143 domain-containing protein [Sulfuricystis multivorans]|uniref:DUF4143 domain-containing protein n=1 Tax=Sulfuricystis multivorans TaxID=2211108 RepID=UPI000F83046B|nr:DUF4143 domain-containing protein [Sulfuricystis multivorans]